MAELEALAGVGAIIGHGSTASVMPAVASPAGQTRILDPQRALIVGILIVVLLLVRVVIVFTSQRGTGGGAPTSYGLAGGAICPRCGGPFALGMFVPHLFGLKMGHCPHCGWWGMVGRASPQDLAAAESKDTSVGDTGTPRRDEADDLRRQVEDSRYQ